jgi:hypothetical protein
MQHEWMLRLLMTPSFQRLTCNPDRYGHQLISKHGNCNIWPITDIEPDQSTALTSTKNDICKAGLALTKNPQ